KWAMNILRGTFIIVDRYHTPYNIERSSEMIDQELFEIPLQSVNGIELGTIFYTSPIQLDETDWPDIMEDLASACRIVLERQSLLQRGSTYKYTNWLSNILSLEVNDEKSNDLLFEGLQLGLPVEKGEVWVL